MLTVGSLRRDLGDGLTLRSARHDDAAELVDFNATMHADVGLPGSTLAEWTRDLFETPHPTFRVERDVTVVEDTASGRIVSALFLIPQVWSYAGVAIKAGQPELIATHPDYRRRGLVRAQFEVIHGWSRAGGQLWQFIAGIAWYYRQFGYAYAVDLPPRPVMWLGETPPPSAEFSLRAATRRRRRVPRRARSRGHERHDARPGARAGGIRTGVGATTGRPARLRDPGDRVDDRRGARRLHRPSASTQRRPRVAAGVRTAPRHQLARSHSVPSSPICTSGSVIIPTVPGEVSASPCQLDTRRHAVRPPGSARRPPARTGCTSGCPMSSPSCAPSLPRSKRAWRSHQRSPGPVSFASTCTRAGSGCASIRDGSHAIEPWKPPADDSESAVDASMTQRRLPSSAVRQPHHPRARAHDRGLPHQDRRRHAVAGRAVPADADVDVGVLLTHAVRAVSATATEGSSRPRRRARRSRRTRAARRTAPARRRRR